MAIADTFNFSCRILQPLIALVILGICAYLVSEFYLPPPSLKFLLFASIWTIFPALPLTIFKYQLLPPYKWSKIGFLLLEVATLVFWFAAFVAVAVWRGGIEYCIGKACGYIVAAIAFGALEWILFSVTTTVHALDVWQTRHNRSGFTTSQPETTTV